jgi:hypothetical protein
MREGETVKETQREFRMSALEQRVIPALRITQYARSKAFYLERLGFELEWEHRFEPHFPVFMSVVRDGMRLYLSEHAGDCQVGGLVHFVIPDVDAWHREFQRRGVQATDPPNNDLGFRNMTVTDPDGNQLRFMEPSNKAAGPNASADGGRDAGS